MSLVDAREPVFDVCRRALRPVGGVFFVGRRQVALELPDLVLRDVEPERMAVKAVYEVFRDVELFLFKYPSCVTT